MKPSITRISAFVVWVSSIVVAGSVVFLLDQNVSVSHITDQSIQSNSLLSVSQAQTAPIPIPVVPCQPKVTQKGTRVDFNCTVDNNNNFDWVTTATVTTTCPVNLAFRSPYPRSLVTVQNTYFLTGTRYYSSPNGVWSNLVSAEKDVNYSPNPRGKQWRNLQIGLRSQQFLTPTNWLSTTAPLPKWTIEDRTWNTGRKFPTSQSGITATFVYETSSFGLLSRGRGFDFVNQKPSDIYDLPAYQVNVSTACGHEWALRWQELMTTTVSSGITYSWATKVITWQPLSLITYGVATTYALQTQSQSGGVLSGTIYLDAQDGIWVPVIEVQSVLTNGSGTPVP